MHISEIFARTGFARIWLSAVLIIVACLFLPDYLEPEASFALVGTNSGGKISGYGNHPPTWREFMLFGVYKNRNLLYVVTRSARLTLYIGFASLLVSMFAGLFLIFFDFLSATHRFVSPVLRLVVYCPRLLVLILLSAFLGLSRPSQLAHEVPVFLIALLGSTGAVFMASQTSGEIASLRIRLYVCFASSLRLPAWKIFTGHILKNCTSIPLTITKQFRDNILFLSTLSFIGLVHLQEPADFGALIFKYTNDPEVLQKAWWALFFPCAALAGLILLFDRIGEKLARKIEKSPVVTKI